MIILIWFGVLLVIEILISLWKEKYIYSFYKWNFWGSFFCIVVCGFVGVNVFVGENFFFWFCIFDICVIYFEFKWCVLIIFMFVFVFGLDLINVLLFEIVVSEGLILNRGMGGWVISVLVFVVFILMILLLRFWCECFGFEVELMVIFCKFGIVLFCWWFVFCVVFLLGLGGGFWYCVLGVVFVSFLFFDW